jgi:hypothetical protein
MTNNSNSIRCRTAVNAEHHVGSVRLPLRQQRPCRTAIHTPHADTSHAAAPLQEHAPPTLTDMMAETSSYKVRSACMAPITVLQCCSSTAPHSSSTRHSAQQHQCIRHSWKDPMPLNVGKPCTELAAICRLCLAGLHAAAAGQAQREPRLDQLHQQVRSTHRPGFQGFRRIWAWAGRCVTPGRHAPHAFW